MSKEQHDCTALIPAAGKGSRLGLGYSKELLPMGFEELPGRQRAPKPVASYLMDAYRKAGVSDIHMILRKGKEDIIEHFQNGENRGLHITYHVTGSDAGVPVTLDEAYPNSKDKLVLFGFPDILFKPVSAMKSMKECLEKEREADLILGLFPVDNPEIWDTVEVDEQDRIGQIWIKETTASANHFAWIMAAWRPRFSEFMHQEVLKTLSNTGHNRNEIYIGEMIQKAIEAGLLVKGIKFYEGKCLDVGTPGGRSKGEQFIINS